MIYKKPNIFYKSSAIFYKKVEIFYNRFYKKQKRFYKTFDRFYKISNIVYNVWNFATQLIMHIKMTLQFNFSLRFQRKVRSTENRVIGNLPEISGKFFHSAFFFLDIVRDISPLRYITKSPSITRIFDVFIITGKKLL